MRVNVLMATYNRGIIVKGLPLVERAIKSFLDQDYENSHLTILNDGSTDNTKDILDRYERHPRITVYNFTENKLPPNNWNWIWDRSEGDLICQLHDDDQLTPDSLTLRVKEFIQDPQLQVVYGGVIAQNMQATDETLYPGQEPSAERIMREEYINFTALMYRPDLPFRFDGTLRYYFDWLFKIRCLRECKTWYVKEAVMRHTVHAGQETNKCRRENMNAIEEKGMRERLAILYP